MTLSQVDLICAQFGVKVDEIHQGAGKFVDLYIGTGADCLGSLMAGLTNAGIGCRMTISHVSNPEHKDFRKSFLEVHSFWNE